MPPFFSVILPTYNRAQMLRTALSTVKWQSCDDWECWVVDDGSSDGTPALVRERSIDLVIANAENAAAGSGLTMPMFAKLRHYGVSVEKVEEAL